MLLESIRIFTDELNLTSTVNQLIYAERHITGEFAYTTTGKRKHQEQYRPEVIRLKKIITSRITKVLP